MKLLNTISLFFFFVITAFCQEEQMYIVLLGGQSNMVGRGQFDELSPSDIVRVDNAAQKISIISNGRKELPLSYQSATKRQINFGPELFFGVTLHEKYPNKKFLFIKEGMGGTSLLGAWNPNWTQEMAILSEKDEKRQTTKLYEKHCNVIQSALAKYPNAKIVGMLWMQGERDTRTEVAATTYKSNLKQLIYAYRNDFKIKNMPFIFGQVNCPPRGKYLEGVNIVRDQMMSTEQQMKNVFMIPTSMEDSWHDYPKKPDNVHYSTEGQKRLGNAFGKTFLAIQSIQNIEKVK
ncbi:sialate O-acetylesterase [Flammeovirga pacifica]|uniref:Sialate O-acetylesterase domain-containing protein n=1 Tax=Flammeovirga pacifica TaxID=915059 RepID=A0A1S1YTU2_FLAPC|nr:sialate O-acetylesterase [Flammeovirga pacifica]OHX64438.1 hypothetical protein NH26_22900 [Flammeovirga pacifica]